MNNPPELIVVIHALSSGEYLLEIITQYGVSTILKETHSAVFEKVLTVI